MLKRDFVTLVYINVPPQLSGLLIHAFLSLFFHAPYHFFLGDVLVCFLICLSFTLDLELLHISAY